MARRIVVVGAAIVAMILWQGPFSVPNWAVIGFVFAVLSLGDRSHCEAHAPRKPPGTHALAGFVAQIAFTLPFSFPA
jgi:hypothetical protein